MNNYVSGTLGPTEIVDATKKMYGDNVGYKNDCFGRQIKIIPNFFHIWWDYDATLGSAVAYKELGRVLKFYGVNLGWVLIGIWISKKV